MTLNIIAREPKVPFTQIKKGHYFTHGLHATNSVWVKINNLQARVIGDTEIASVPVTFSRSADSNMVYPVALEALTVRPL